MRCFGANENVCQDNWFSLYINIMRFEIFPIVMSILSSYNTFAIHMLIFVQLLLNYFIVYKKIDIILQFYQFYYRHEAVVPIIQQNDHHQ